MTLFDEFVPLSKIAKLLRMTESVKKSDYDENEFFNDVVDMLTYISKSENHVIKLAQNTEIYKILNEEFAHITKNRHAVIHSLVSLSASLIDDKTTKNQELAQDKWGADMEGFLLLEQLREKVSSQVTYFFNG